MMIKKIRNFKFVIHNCQKGMSYVELIVVLGIFSVMTSISLFNYGSFQAKVDIKNLASDIALKVVEAQKSSLSGKLPPLVQQGQVGPTWRPSYGIYIDQATDNKSFSYFVDIDSSGFLSNPDCASGGECLNKIPITKGNTISDLKVFYQDGTSASLSDLAITFQRPNSGAIINTSLGFISVISYIEIKLASIKEPTAVIKIYPSGRIQVN
ncbi:MAG: type II secretion system protein [Candidatus Parcubacteria bacterium]|nr:type II secretion system protein [Candidatus Parcubacteria bacterium]